MDVQTSFIPVWSRQSFYYLRRRSIPKWRLLSLAFTDYCIEHLVKPKLSSHSLFSLDPITSPKNPTRRHLNRLRKFQKSTGLLLRKPCQQRIPRLSNPRSLPRVVFLPLLHQPRRQLDPRLKRKGNKQIDKIRKLVWTLFFKLLCGGPYVFSLLLPFAFGSNLVGSLPSLSVFRHGPKCWSCTKLGVLSCLQRWSCCRIQMRVLVPVCCNQLLRGMEEPTNVPMTKQVRIARVMMSNSLLTPSIRLPLVLMLIYSWKHMSLGIFSGFAPSVWINPFQKSCFQVSLLNLPCPSILSKDAKQKAALKAKLRRLCEYKRNHKLQVPEWLHKQWKENAGNHLEMALQFQKTGFNKDLLPPFSIAKQLETVYIQ